VTILRGARKQRLVSRCYAEFVRPAGLAAAETEDISERGAFVRTDAMLPVGATTMLTVSLPSGEHLRFSARVAHVLMPAAARALGRHVGIGFEFLGTGPAFADLREHLDNIAGETTNPGVNDSTLAIIAEPSEPLRARLARCLERAGFSVRTYASAADALSASTGWKPNVVVSAIDMEGMSGIDLAYAMADHASMSQVPLILISEAVTDMTRLEAFRAGVRDLIPRPFLDEELLIRVHRVATQSGMTAAMGLRGTIADVSLGTLLSLFEFERKSGVLLVTQDQQAARLFVCNGRIVKIEGAGNGVARERLMRVLDWKSGQFEFMAGPVAVVDEVDASTTNILLEHAQRQDEASA
jgi:DNA-binding response OmpR family regulator/Tfp pilus assembly protein PilZ